MQVPRLVQRLGRGAMAPSALVRAHQAFLNCVHSYVNIDPPHVKGNLAEPEDIINDVFRNAGQLARNCP